MYYDDLNRIATIDGISFDEKKTVYVYKKLKTLNEMKMKLLSEVPGTIIPDLEDRLKELTDLEVMYIELLKRIK